MKTITYLRFLAQAVGMMLLISCSSQSDFLTLDGKEHKLNDYLGKWVIINFWAEWCAPCLEEIPELNSLHQQREKHNLVIIGVSYDPLEIKELHSIVKKWDIQYPIMSTKPSPILPFGLPKTLPGNYIINPEGEVVAKLSGTQTKEKLIGYIAELQKGEG